MWSFLVGLSLFCGSKWWNIFKIHNVPQSKSLWDLRLRFQNDVIWLLNTLRRSEGGGPGVGWSDPIPFPCLHFYEDNPTPPRLFHVCHHLGRIKSHLYFCGCFISFSIMSSTVQSCLTLQGTTSSWRTWWKLRVFPLEQRTSRSKLKKSA